MANTPKPASTASERKNKSSVPSVEKALDVIELLSSSEDGLTMNEIVDALDRSMGEVYRIIVYLGERGYLEQNPNTNRYALTLRLFELSHRFEPTERIIRNAVPLMERFAVRTDQSVHLGVLNRTNVLILTSVKSPRPAGYAVRTGAVFPMHQTSTGSVILAFSENAVRQRYLSRLTKEEREAAKERLEDIRQSGFENGGSTLVEGIKNLSAPIFDSRGIVAALTSGYIGQPDQPTSPEEALAELITSAQQLSHSLGFRVENSEFGDIWPG